jgi:hypothetical protein
MKQLGKIIPVDELYWFIKFGKSKQKCNIYDLRADNFNGIERPVFFLSTGRCGTKWFSSLLSFDKRVRVLHNPVPNLGSQSKAVYEIFINNDWNLDGNYLRLIEEIYLTGREQHLRYSFKTNKRIIETNNNITFFAPVLSVLFPDSKFVHLYRDPGGFVRSGIIRGWFTERYNSIFKINPTEKNNLYKEWVNMNQLQKISWVWSETNSFIERFKQLIPAGRMLAFDFKEISSIQKITDLLNFCEINISESKIHKILGRKENAQPDSSFPRYADWPDNQKQQLKALCASLAEKYNYSL